VFLFLIASLRPSWLKTSEFVRPSGSLLNLIFGCRSCNHWLGLLGFFVRVLGELFEVDVFETVIYTVVCIC